MHCTNLVNAQYSCPRPSPSWPPDQKKRKPCIPVTFPMARLPSLEDALGKEKAYPNLSQMHPAGMEPGHTHVFFGNKVKYQIEILSRDYIPLFPSNKHGVVLEFKVWALRLSGCTKLLLKHGAHVSLLWSFV